MRIESSNSNSNGITYTFSATCPVPEIAGKTFYGGKLTRRLVNRRSVDVIEFAGTGCGKNVMVMVAGKPELEAQVAEIKKAQAERDADLLRAQAAYEQTPRGAREKLATEEYNTYSANHYPGSKAWFRNSEAAKALREFDSAHPELIAELTAERNAKAKADYDALSDFAKAGS